MAKNAVEQPKDTEKSMRLYTVRDYYNNRNLDLFYRDFLSRYVLRQASYAAMTGDAVSAKKYITAAAKLAGDSPAALTEITRISLYELMDAEMTINYLKQMTEQNPYDMNSLKLLSNIYMQVNPEEAFSWMTVHYSRMPNGKEKKEFYNMINFMQEQMRKQQEQMRQEQQKQEQKGNK
jgi:hypothetical protein